MAHTAVILKMAEEFHKVQILVYVDELVSPYEVGIVGEKRVVRMTPPPESEILISYRHPEGCPGTNASPIPPRGLQPNFLRARTPGSRDGLPALDPSKFAAKLPGKPFASLVQYFGGRRLQRELGWGCHLYRMQRPRSPRVPAMAGSIGQVWQQVLKRLLTQSVNA